MRRRFTREVHVRLTRSLTAAALGVLWTVPGAAQNPGSAPQKVTLTYRWPQQARVDVELVQVQVTEDGERRDSVEFRRTLRLALHSRAGGLELRLVRLELMAQGRPIATPLVFADQDSLVTPRLLVDSLGAVSDVRGLESFVAGLQRAAKPRTDSLARLSPGLVQVYGSLVSEARIQDVIASFWNEAVAVWIGGEFEIGQEYDRIDTTRTLGGAYRDIPSLNTFAAVGRTACAEGLPTNSCLHLAFRQLMDPTTLRERLQEMLSRAVPPVAIDSLSQSVVSHVFTDPATLIPRAIHREEKMAMGTRSPGQPTRRNVRSMVTTAWIRVTPVASALHVATAGGDLEGVIAALSAGEPVDLADDQGRTPLVVAVQRGREAVARRLLASGAHAPSAYAVARTLGDTDAMRWLQSHAAVERVAARPLTELEALADSAGEAITIPALADRVVADDADVDSRRALATTLIAVYRDTLAEREARRLLERDACDGTALHVLVSVHGIRFGRGAAPIDSSLAYADRQRRCAPASGEAWSNFALVSLVAGDSGSVRRAIDALAGLDYFTPAHRAALRWTLDALPRDAMLATDISLDWLLIRILQRDGLRPDVHLVHADPATALRAAGGRRVTAVPWIVLDSSGWRSQGAYLELATTPLERTTRATAWPSIRRIAREMKGPQVAGVDRPFSRNAFDLRHALAFALARYLSSVDPTPALTEPQHLADADSASRLMMELVPGLGRDEWYFRETFARMQGWIADVWLHHGRPWRGIPHVLDALEAMPAADNLWNTLAYHYLVSGDLAGADSAARRAVLIGESLSAILNVATLARLHGHADSSLATLERGRAKLDSLRAVEADSAWGWSLSYLPRSTGDTLAARPAFSIHTHDARAAFYLHNRALALALKADVAGADRAVREARALFDLPAFRCVIVSLSEATRAFAAVPDRARAWYVQYERALRTGASCPDTPSSTRR